MRGNVQLGSTGQAPAIASAACVLSLLLLLLLLLLCRVWALLPYRKRRKTGPWHPLPLSQQGRARDSKTAKSKCNKSVNTVVVLGSGEIYTSHGLTCSMLHGSFEACLVLRQLLHQERRAVTQFVPGQYFSCCRHLRPQMNQQSIIALRRSEDTSDILLGALFSPRNCPESDTATRSLVRCSESRFAVKVSWQLECVENHAL